MLSLSTVNIVIKDDYFAYIKCENPKLFDLIKRSYTRKERKFNNFYKLYETVKKKHYTLVDKESTIKVKAGTISFLCNSLYVNNINYNLIDERNKLNIENISYYLNDDINLRQYQKDAVKAVFNKPFSSVQLPTASGKTECSATIIKNFLSNYKDKAFLYVVPVLQLQKESKERFEEYGIEVNTDFPIQTGKVNILTYLGLLRADNDKLDYKQRNSVGAIIFDEMHHLGANKSSKIVCRFKQLYMCVGMSATPSNDISKKRFLKDLTDKEFNVYGSTGKLCYKMEIIDSIENDFVVPIEIRVLENKNKYNLDSDENDWHVIKEIILKDEERAKLVANYTKHIQIEANLNTIVLLIPEVKWSRIYMKQMADLYKNTDVCIFELYGNNIIYEYINNEPVKVKDNDRIYDMIRNPNIKTIFSCTSFFFEGVNIKNLQALINVYGGRDVKRIKQQAGRVMRLFENKNIAYIHEIKDTNNPVLMSQFDKRIDIYKQEYNAKIINSSFKL